MSWLISENLSFVDRKSKMAVTQWRCLYLIFSEDHWPAIGKQHWLVWFSIPLTLDLCSSKSMFATLVRMLLVWSNIPLPFSFLLIIYYKSMIAANTGQLIWISYIRGVRVMLFNATFNNISVISWRFVYIWLSQKCIWL